MDWHGSFSSSGELSSRLNRLLAALFDSMLWALFPTLGMLGGFSWVAGALLEAQLKGAPPSFEARPGGAVGALLVGSAVATLLVALYQLWGLAVRGQTLGKQLFAMQIVDAQGRAAGFLRTVVLRSFVFSVLVSIAQACLAWVGAVLPLANVLFIFGPQKRCLHDYVAGTWVRDCDLPARSALPALAVFGAAAVGLGALLAHSGVDLDELRAVAEKAAAAGPLRQQLTGQQGWKPGGEAAPPPAASAPKGPGPTGNVHLSPKRTGRIYRYEDENGTVQFSDELESIPKKYRARARPIE